MLGSALLFGLMAVAIRLASKSLHTFEIAFFRNFFGLLAATPLLARHGTQILRTTQFPRYIIRCVIGVLVDVLRLLGHRPPAARAGDLAVVFHAAVRHHRRRVDARRTGARATLGRGAGRLHRRADHRAPRQRELHPGHAGRAVRGGVQRTGGDPDQATLAHRTGRPHRAVHDDAVGADVAAAGAVRVGMAAGHHMAVGGRCRRARHSRRTCCGRAA